MRKNNITLVGLLTITGFPLVAYLIFIIFNDNSFLSIFKTKSSIYIEIYMGVLFGILAGTTAWDIVNSKLINPALNKYKKLIVDLNLKLSTIIFVSMCAGVGEEIMFRGVLQPLLGIWITAILFVAIHGYLNPTDWRLSIYGIYMTLIIAVIGLFTQLFGLTSAMIAHAIIDVILFRKLSKD